MDDARRSNALVCPAYQGYPRNQWYVVAFSNEVKRELLQRRVLGDLMVLYRTEDGMPVALADRCPHRGMPLSKGTLIGDAIQCGYHGFTFGATGGCVRVPSQDAIPSKMAVHKYPLVEKWQWIWAWMGDPAKADPAMIPDHHELGLGRAGYTASAIFCMEIKANYQLLHENLLDTSHIQYLHPGQLDNDNAGEATFKTEYLDDRIRIVREMPNTLLNAAMARLFKLPEGSLIDRDLVTETYPPNLSVVQNVFREPGRPNDPPKVHVIVPMAITPGGPRLTYQFTTVATSYPEQRTKQQNDHVWNVFTQDRDALEAIQQGFDELGPDAPEFSVKADQAALRCRQIITDMVRREEARG
jgi:vanillate O-demethylase monooxygenase subunit